MAPTSPTSPRREHPRQLGVAVHDWLRRTAPSGAYATQAVATSAPGCPTVALQAEPWVPAPNWARVREQTEDERYVLEDEHRLWSGRARLPRISSRNRPQPSRRSDASGRTPRGDVDVLREIPPPEYFAILAQVDVPDEGGMVRCPLHDDGSPSCRVYAEAERGWVCFAGCGGGTIYDLARGLSGIGDRGAAFHELRGWIAGRLTGSAA